MPLTKLQFKPGINRETTSYTNEGGWFDCDKVRFRAGFPEKIGGWEKKSRTSFLGTCRAIIPWVSIDGTQYIGVGTHLKYYIEEGGGYNDITPIRSTTSAGDVTFSATDGSTTITVSDTDHGAIEGDFVTFSGADSLGGLITADILNQEYRVDSVISNSSYIITSSVAANSSDTGDGGSSAVGEYQINIGLDTTISGNGWGAGFWSRGAWGSGADLTAVSDILRIWSHDNFGEDLIISVRNGGIYYWDKTSGLQNRAIALSEVAGADEFTPTTAKQVIVSDRDRHVIVFGADPLDNIGNQDPLLIRFSDQEDALTWFPRPENTAGDLRISSGSEIICALETRQQILVWTDVSLHSMQFLGPPFTFGIDQISNNTTIMSPMSAVAVDDLVFWMGAQDFYAYDGRVRRLPCSVKEYVFGDFNDDQAEKVTAGVNSAFNEVWWFYPSADSEEINRYVIYNYLQDIWYFGEIQRTAWIDRGINKYPIAAYDGSLYLHEIGYNDGSTTPESPISAYVESSQIDISEGDKFAFIRRIIPDVSFDQSTAEEPTMDMIVKVRNFPGTNYSNSNTASVERSATVPVEQFTDQVHLRLRGRSFALRAESDDLDVKWKLGSPRIDIRTDGRR